MFLVTDDEFFESLTQNYAQIIYKIIGIDWNTDPGKEEKKISLRRLKKYVCKAEGYERDILALIYGSTGVMSLGAKTEYIGGKIELRDVSETSPSEITGLVR